MRPGYTIKHWLLTIAISPITEMLIAAITGKDSNHVLLPLELIWYFWIFGFLFSLPAFALYLVLFYLLYRLSTPVETSKVILIIVSGLCIIFTFSLLETPELIMAYTLTAVITGFFLKLKKQDKVVTQN